MSIHRIGTNMKDIANDGTGNGSGRNFIARYSKGSRYWLDSPAGMMAAAMYLVLHRRRFLFRVGISETLKKGTEHGV